MTKVTSGQFQREFGRYRTLAQREPVIITNHGRDDVVLLGAEDYARLRRYEQRAFHVSELPRDVIAGLGKVKIPKAANEKARQRKKSQKDKDRGRER
jgi:prevent-host-death family protein